MSQLIDNLYSIDSIKSGIKSAIEGKGVDMTGLSFADYPAAISQISGGGGNMSTLSVSVNGTYYPEAGYDGFSEVSVNVLPNLGYDYVFSSNGFYKPEDYGYDGFAKIVVDVPQSVTVGIPEKDVTEKNVHIINLNNSASFVASAVFSRNPTLQTVYLPNCINVGIEAFSYCGSLTQVDLPICTSIQQSAFYSCTSLLSVNIPECTSMFNNAFAHCISLQNISCRKIKTIYTNAFYGCGSLQSIDLPECTYIGSAAFRYCTLLSLINIPTLSTISYLTFGRCVNLSSVELPECSTIYSQAFAECSTLSLVVLGYSSVCKLLNSNAFTSTPIASGTGSIYVPSSLVSDYQAATNWSYFSSQIFSIPE